MRRIAVLAFLLSPLAHADPSAATKISDEADALVGKGDFIGAAAKFRAAFGEDPRPDLMCNVGVAYYKAKVLPSAHRYLDQCLAIGTQLEPAFIANVRAVIAAVEAKLAAGEFTPIDLIVEPSHAATSGPFDEPVVGSRRVWVPFGQHTLVVHADGFVDRTEQVDARKRDPVTVRLKLEKRADIAPLPPPREQRSSSKLPAIATSVGSFALGGAAYWFVTKALDYRDRSAVETDFARFTEQQQSSRRWETAAWVTGGVAVGGVVLSGYLWYRATRSTTTRVEVTATGDGASVMLGGRW